ncbi:protein PelD [Permianibacter sp. IMCC34836]|uniref:PelD GGDEF domain-containing protein n=1 Tax=Permianibacter fluminis TaxID=2738515 RepID=UPI001554F2E3|nr:PelD GGDEF domain-containing protein [Permianibacter fluminis]NQD37310.1 protein PelD [Permianibacter fluminis]
MRLPWLDSVDGLDVRTAPSDRWMWLETLVLTVAALALSAWSNPQDPLRVQSGFPWPLLGPVLAGLRYGFAAGFVSALLVLATLGISINRGWQPAAAFPLAWATGVVALAMVCGEFRDGWQRRLVRLAGANRYRAERLEEFTRSYHLLRVSHDRLEQALAGAGHSLREALTRLAQRFDPGQGLTELAANRLLELLAHYGALQQAGLFAVTEDGRCTGEALAQWGKLARISATDPLLLQALQRAELVAVNADNAQLEAARHSELLAVVPLVDSSGRIHAVLAIAALPFFSFQQNTLTLLTVLCAHAADLLTGAGKPGSDDSFSRQLARALKDQEDYGLPASLVQVTVAGTEGQQWCALARRERRALDLWRERGDELTILLPLTDVSGGEQWLQRLRELGAPALSVRCLALDNASAAQALLPMAGAH